MTRPLIGIVASFVESSNGRMMAHQVNERNVDALERFANAVPLIIPALGSRLQLQALIERVDGIMLTGGRANVEPHHYEGPEFPPDEPVDPARDSTVLPLVRACVAHELPVFGICRGIQEINVALGGTLHYRVHLLPGMEDHRMPRHENPSFEEVFRLRHHLNLKPDGLLAELAGAPSVQVNSLHGQGIDRVADALEVEATAEDGCIEAVRLKHDPGFTVGVQWHAEWKPEEHSLSARLFERFGDAARDAALQRRLGTARAVGESA